MKILHNLLYLLILLVSVTSTAAFSRGGHGGGFHGGGFHGGFHQGFHGGGFHHGFHNHNNAVFFGGGYYSPYYYSPCRQVVVYQYSCGNSGCGVVPVVQTVCN